MYNKPIRKETIIFSAVILGALIVVIFVLPQNTFLTLTPTTTTTTTTQEPSVTAPERGYEIASLPGDRSIVSTFPPNRDFFQYGQFEMREVEEGVGVFFTLWSGVAISTDYSVNIYEGECGALGSVRHELSPIIDGSLSDVPVRQSFTTLNLTVDELVRQFPLAIDVRLSKDNQKSIACESLVRF